MLMFALSSHASLAISLLQDSIGSDLADQGHKILAGFVIGVVVAITFTIVKLRLRDRKPPRAFISVTSCTDEETTSKPAGD